MSQEELKNYFWILLDLALVAIVMLVVFFAMPAVQKYGDSLAPTRTMTVSAEGKATVSPDLATLSFSVVSRGPDPETVAGANNETMNKVLEFVKAQGIDAKDVKTTAYNLSPEYRYEPEKAPRITGYVLTQSAQVNLRDFGKIGKVLAGLTPLGVNQIGGVSFTIEEPEKFLGAARADAFRKAQAKAREMTGQNKVRLGKLLNVYEYAGPTPAYYEAAKGGFGGERGAPPLPTIEPGTEEVRVQVTLTYALK